MGIQSDITFRKQYEEGLRAEKKYAEHSLLKLKDTQSQLVQAEKMSSLGQLTAGIAHEINNPINFVFAGASTLKTIMGDIHNVLDKYNNLNEIDDSKVIQQRIKEIEDFKEEVYFQDIKEDTDNLLSDILNGAERTQSIVSSLRTFSRLGEEDSKQSDLQENLESTLVILNTKLKGRIEVVKDFEPTFPICKL